ncbi:hypothetical protein ABIA22_000396 [Sinorhizobium fredii]|uniref:hypothetical protein n=1 Tax=Rhizobium fredii TaxID=380 RepID=UPI0035122B97
MSSYIVARFLPLSEMGQNSMSSTLVTAWDGRPDLSAYLDFLEWGLSHAPTVRAYRMATGDKWLPSPSGDGRAAFLQRFSDWVEENLYGKPEHFRC